MKPLSESAIRKAQEAFRFAWPAFNRWWDEKRRDGLVSGELPIEPFEAAVEAYLRANK